jgi:hypothetical protein
VRWKALTAEDPNASLKAAARKRRLAAALATALSRAQVASATRGQCRGAFVETWEAVSPEGAIGAECLRGSAATQRGREP